MIFAGLLASVLAVGTVLEASHHHDAAEEGPAACCGHSCTAHHNSLEAPAVALGAPSQDWLTSVSEQFIEPPFSKQLFRPPAA